jgi:hypothetical protein
LDCNMKKFPLLYLIRVVLCFLAFAFLAGCDVISPVALAPTWTVQAPRTPGPRLLSTATPAQGAVVFTDTFETPDTGWVVESDDTSEYKYIDGAYAITVSEKETMRWSYAGQSYSDIVLSVDAWAVQVPENENNSFGLICRGQENGDGYLFRISSDGMYAISRVTDDEFTTLAGWEETDVINYSNQVNTIEASCDGPYLDLSINGTQVAEVVDFTFTSGDIGLTATTYEDTPTEVYFDNFIVRNPSE